MNEIQLIKIEQRAEKATSGPWKVESSMEGDWVLDNRDDVIAGTFVQEGDAEFIAHAREDVPALIAEIRRIRDFNLRLQQRISELEEAADYAVPLNDPLY